MKLRWLEFFGVILRTNLEKKQTKNKHIESRVYLCVDSFATLWLFPKKLSYNTQESARIFENNFIMFFFRPKVNEQHYN